MKLIIAKKLLKMTNDLYNTKAQSFSDTRKEVWEKEILDFVEKIEPGSSILDLGCGNARLLALLNSKHKTQNLKPQPKSKNLNTKNHSHVLQNTRITYTGIDSSKKLIEMNKKNYSQDSKSYQLKAKSSFEVENGLTMNLDRQFDYVISIAVLHHIPSEELQLKFMKNIHQALKPNSKVLISVWNRWQTKYEKYLISENPKSQSASLRTNTKQIQNTNDRNPKNDNNLTMQQFNNDLGAHDQIVPWKQSGQFRYIHVFTPTELKTLAQKAGFKNIKVTTSKHGQKTSIDKALGIYLIAEK